MPAPATPYEAIALKLSNAAGVTALVGTRIYPDLPTQEPTWPYIVVILADGGAGIRVDGPTTTNNYTMRVMCFGKTNGEAEQVRIAAVVPLNGIRDRTNNIEGCSPVGDASLDVNDDGTRASSQSFSLWFRG
jgi:hypothetical protein